MAWYEKLRGTIETIFKLGLNGINLKNNSGVLEARNADDSALVVVRGAEPVGSSDLVTKNYVDTQINGNILGVKFTITTTGGISTVSIPASSTILDCIVDITTAYSAGATITVGNIADPSQLQDTMDNNPQIVSTYSKEQLTSWANDAPVQATVNGSPTTGAATIMVIYMKPIAIL